MKLYLRVKKPGENARIQVLFEGLVIGRSTKANFLIQDPKISGLHAKVEKQKGRFKLIDLGSSNGILHKGKKVKTLTLSPGKKFQIGDVGFDVKRRGINWRTVVYNFLRKALKSSQIKNKPQVLHPLTPPLYLYFSEGLQKGERWFVGYVPRSIGKASFDLTILDPQAPDECFRLITSKKNVIYKTQVPEVVSINKKALREKILSSQDAIRIGRTTITVKFENES